MQPKKPIWDKARPKKLGEPKPLSPAKKGAAKKAAAKPAAKKSETASATA